MSEEKPDYDLKKMCPKNIFVACSSLCPWYFRAGQSCALLSIAESLKAIEEKL